MRLRWCTAGVLIVALVLGGVGSARAQSSTIGVQVAIRQALESSIQSLERSLNELAEPQQALKSNYQGYATLRTAHEQVNSLIARTKYPNPLHQIASDKLQEARNAVLQARDAIQYQNATGAERATQLTSQAIARIEIVLISTF